MNPFGHEAHLNKWREKESEKTMCRTPAGLESTGVERKKFGEQRGSGLATKGWWVMFPLVPRRVEGLPRALTRMERPFHLLRNEFAPLFERFFGPWPLLAEEMWERPWGLDLSETEKEVLVRAELPGFELANLEVLVTGNELTIEAKHAVEAKAAEKETSEEKAYARVRRIVTLPEGLELGKIEATYRNGVLEVRIPKGPETVARKVEVKA